MSNSKLVSYTKISPNKTKARKYPITRISIHCVVGQLTVETLGNVFAPASCQASSNYGIGKDGRVGMYVEECDRSWCTSSSDNDNRAVTIEVASDTVHPYAVTSAAYATLLDLCEDICKRNGKKKLIWFADKEKALAYKPVSDEMVLTVHRWFANKACPGEYLYSRHGEIAAEVTKRLSGAVKDSETDNTEKSLIEDSGYTLKQFVKEIQMACGASVDGIAGPETLSKTVTLSASKNRRHAAVELVQKRLHALGYTEVGEADGIAGAKFTQAVKHFQKDNGCVADGEITKGNKTWRMLLGMK
jgi:N-acetyl-anhydromuramyl-L-alanine amidase AmpD